MENSLKNMHGAGKCGHLKRVDIVDIGNSNRPDFEFFLLCE